jgi:hypothetical protein
MHITQITPDQIILSTEVAEVFQKIRQLENKDDPNRRGDLFGPYELLWLEKTGKLPSEYFEENDPEPWKLLSDEARRNISWQALSGCLDINQEWALIYIQLVMDKSLNDDEFARELEKVNKQFLHSLDHRHGGNHHHAMKHQMGHIDCPGCSATAALLMVDPQIRQTFEKELKGLNKLTKHERLELLRSQGLYSYLNMTIQHEQSGKIILPKP